jgi:hypothetical protein
MENNENNQSISDDTGIEVYLRNLENTLLNREWLETRSKFELMDLVQFLAVQMYKQSTTQLRQTASRSRMDTKFPSVSVEPATEFEMVPADSDGSGDYLRVVLVGSKTAPLNRGFQIVGQAVIGRDDGESTVDIDLTDFGPEVRGVSRRHAEFKVRDGKLYVVDLGSSNGTYLKGKRIEAGRATEVANGSVLSFGALHVQVQIFD